MAEKVLEGIAQKLESDLGGDGRLLFNAEGIGNAIKHLVNVVNSNSQPYPMEGTSGAPLQSGYDEPACFSDQL